MLLPEAGPYTISQELSMPSRFKLKMKTKHGLARIHVLLMVLIAILLVLISIPGYKAYKYHADWLLCADSLRVVNGALTVDFITNLKDNTQTLDDAEDALVAILPGRDGYCPVGGTVYFTKDDSGTWRAVCGAHDSDHALRCRLNASYVLSQLRTELRLARRTDPFPKELEVKLNGKTLTCILTEEETGLKRGTATTRGYSGTVAYYGIEGYGNVNGGLNGSGVAEGEICYLSFADEDNNATWRPSDGWTGSAYGDLY